MTQCSILRYTIYSVPKNVSLQEARRKSLRYKGLGQIWPAPLVVSPYARMGYVKVLEVNPLNYQSP